MNSNIILFFLIILLAYTLYYTYEKDYGLFLFILLLILCVIYLYKLVDESFGYGKLFTTLLDKLNILNK